jgi:exodeoxyribonuclease VII small subunit
VSEGAPPPIDDDLGYNDALIELEEILGRLESTAVDVDELGQQVRRAAELIEHCRRRLRLVEDDVSAVLTDLRHLAAEPNRSVDEDPTP